ncbi:MAG: outer membrane beta-barrel protein [Xanthobacteraceae bacterium]
MPFDWSGGYIGGHLGGGFGAATVDGPFGPSIYGDVIRMPSAFAGVQAGYNWQTSPHLVFGVEADVSAMDANGANTCLAPSGALTSFSCRARYETFGSVTGRVGVAGGIDGRSLVYVKGGAAWLTSRFDVALNAFEQRAPAEAYGTQWGWTAGLGLEQALTPAWSLRLEYSHARFGGPSVTSPDAYVQATPALPIYNAVPGGPTSADHSLHLIRLGLNYRIGADPRATWPQPRLAAKVPALSPGWQVEVGGRYWYSSGRFQKDLGAGTSPAQQNVLVSRLTYDTTGHSGEVFGRVDSPARVFVKGFAGGGTLGDGKMHDEDWLAHEKDSLAYSNTLSGYVPGRIGYATLDLGYDVLSTDRVKLGGFVGYHYNRDEKMARGCIQLAHPLGPCSAPNNVALSGNVISEDNTIHAVRLGVAGQVALAPGLRLAAEAAYLPYVRVTGLDGHLLRTDVTNIWSPEFANGRGAQLEAVLSYALTPNLDLGIGGRYWATWATDDAYTNAFGLGCPCQTLPVRLERYGLFVQASYRFEPRL